MKAISWLYREWLFAQSSFSSQLLVNIWPIGKNGIPPKFAIIYHSFLTWCVICISKEGYGDDEEADSPDDEAQPPGPHPAGVWGSHSQPAATDIVLNYTGIIKILWNIGLNKHQGTWCTNSRWYTCKNGEKNTNFWRYKDHDIDYGLGIFFLIPTFPTLSDGITGIWWLLVSIVTANNNRWQNRVYKVCYSIIRNLGQQ